MKIIGPIEDVERVVKLSLDFLQIRTEKFFSFTGDTAYHPPIIEHVKGSPLLIHEAAMGPIAVNQSDNVYLHSSSLDAAEIAKAADVGKLLLVHGSRSKAEECVEVARNIFSKSVEWPKDGQTYVL